VNLRTTSVWLAQAAWLLCGCSSGDSSAFKPDPGPVVTRGTVSVSVTSTGAELDSDGYALLIDGVNVGTISGTSNSSVPNLRTGEHSVGMTGLSCNCTVVGLNPQVITVSNGVTTPTSFAVSCPDHTLDPEVTALQVAGDGFAMTAADGHVLVARTEHPASPAGDVLAVSALTFDATAPFRTIRFTDPNTAMLDELHVAMLDASDAIVAVTRQPTSGTQTQVRLFRCNNVVDTAPGNTVWREMTPLALGYSLRSAQANGLSLPVVVWDDETQPGSHLSMVGVVDNNGVATTLSTLADQPAHVGITIGSADSGYLAGVTTPGSIELHPLDLNGVAAQDFQVLADSAAENPTHEATSVAWCIDRYAVTWWRAAPDPGSTGVPRAELRAVTVNRNGEPLQAPVTLGAAVDLSGGADLHGVGIGCLENAGFAIAHADEDTGLHLLLTDANLTVQVERSIATADELAGGTAPKVVANNTTVLVAWTEAPGDTRVSRSCQ
jgi:hypothetical protein